MSVSSLTVLLAVIMTVFLILMIVVLVIVFRLTDTIKKVDFSKFRQEEEKVYEEEIVNIANPLAEQLKSNNNQIEIYQNQLEQLRQDKKDIAQTVSEDINARPVGFIEELEATLKVVSNSIVSLVFYIVLFCFLTFLELFVLTIKMGDTKCDYDLIVESQLKLKKNLMDQTSQSLMIKKVA